MEGLLKVPGERRQLIDLLLKLPNMGNAAARRLLVASLPRALQDAIPAADAAGQHIANIVDTVNNDPYVQLADGSWPIMIVIEDAMYMVRGTTLENELKALLDTLKERAAPAPPPPQPGPPPPGPQAAPAGGALQLTGDQRRRLQQALLSAFPTRGALAQMVYFGLETNLDTITGGGNLAETVFDLMQWADSRGKNSDLITAALQANPTNPALRALAEEVQLVAGVPVEVDVEAIVNRSAHFSNVETWRTRLSEIELAVCRVEYPPGTGMGTGFLLGPDVLMTNYHVIEPVRNNPGQVTLRFDYKVTADGQLQPGQTYKLAATDWLLSSSPQSGLDYALLRIAGAPGNEPVGGQVGAPPRKWLTPAQTHTYAVNEPLFIIQHPSATPLKLAVGAITNVAARRLRYNANTEAGSSGSPCFTDEWELVALHRAGAENQGYNEGVPFSAIIEHLRQENRLSLLGL